MLIKTKMDTHNVLYIIAYTFSSREWMALDEILGRAGISSKYSPLEQDESGRDGRRYYAETPQQIDSLAGLLQGHFNSQGRFEPARGTGRRYACREVRHSGMGNGCQEFDAPDDSAAMVRCGIIAGQRSWFGGEAKQGNCAPRGFLGRVFR